MQPYEAGIQPQHINFKIKSRAFSEDDRSSNGLISAIGKVTDIEALNKSTKALKVLHQTAIAGGPRLQGIIEGGADRVIGTVTGAMGVDMDSKRLLNGINKINPSVVNHVVKAATDIHDKISKGNFQIEDIPLYVRDFANMFKNIGKIFNPNRPDNDFREVEITPNYAAKMMSMGNKLSHRFLVVFNVAPEYRESMGVWDQALMVYYADRPGMNVNYIDINRYSYRTKVPVNINYEPIRLSLYDDEDGQVNSFANLYQKILSPVSNITPAGQTMYDMEIMNYKGLENPTGLHSIANMPRDFSATENIDYNSSSLGYLKGEATNVFTSITLFHLYQGGSLMDMYTLANPRILSITRSPLDMSESSNSILDFQIDFDTVYTDTYLPSGDIVYRVNQGNKNDLSTNMDLQNFAAAVVPPTENPILANMAEEATKQNRMQSIGASIKGGIVDILPPNPFAR